MPNIKAAAKSLRQTNRRTLYNSRVKRRVKGAVREVSDLIESGNAKEASEKLARAQKMLDKAAKNGTIKKGTAARRKSRLAKQINTISAQNDKGSKSDS